MTFLDNIDHFREVQQQYAEFGASDTEPRVVFEYLIEDAFNGRGSPVPTSPEAWQIFSDMPGADVVALKLAEAAEPAVAAARVAGVIKRWIEHR